MGAAKSDLPRETRGFPGAVMGAMANFVWVFRCEKFLPENGAK